MNNVRTSIKKKISTLGRHIRNTNFSELSDSIDNDDKVIEHDFLTFDYSKQRIDKKTLDYLTQIPDLIDLKESLHQLFTG